MSPAAENPPSTSAASAPTPTPTRSAAPEPARAAKIFAADVPQGQDVLGLDALLRPLAELAAHRDSEAPLTIGLLGGPGAGKSFALRRLLATAEGLSAASSADEKGNFLAPVLTVEIDALRLPEAPSVALAAALYDRLSEKFPQLAREAAHAVRDPQVVAREAAEELDTVRRRLDAERQKLTEIESRRAKLPETILFEQAGSQVDSFARANRARIESRLEGFGLTGEPIQNYKSLLRDIAESGGTSARIGIALRAFWAFKGQGRLIAMAIICVLIAIGCGWAVAHQSEWLAAMRENASYTSTAGWLEAHITWLNLVKQFAWLGAIAAIGVNLWRGLRFLRPLYRGVNLLEAEVAERRRDLDTLYAHQMRRVDALTADVELFSRRADEADRRAATAGSGEHKEPSPFASAAPQAQAERFFSALADAVERGNNGSVAASAMPRRIVVGLDNVDRLSQGAAFALLDAAARDFARPAFVTVVAGDLQRLASSAPGTQPLFSKWIHLPLHVGAQWDDSQAGLLVAQALGTPGIGNSMPRSQPLEWAVSGEEMQLLTALAPLAGASPRAVKRFVNLYRVARAYAPEDKAVVALMLAVSEGGNVAEIAAVEKALTSTAPEAAFTLYDGAPRLREALAAVEAQHGPVTVGTAHRAMAIAQALSLRH